MRTKLSSTIFLAILACLLWASAFVGIKIGLQYTTPLQFAGIRFFISGLIVLPFSPQLKNYFHLLVKNWKVVFIITLLQTFVHYSLFYTGISMVPGALGAIVVGAGPLFVAIVAHFGMPDDKMSWQKVGVILLGLAGVVMVSLERGSFSGEGKLILAGIGLLILTNINSGFTNIIVARDKDKVPPLVLSSASMTFGGLMLFLFSIPVEGLHFSAKPIEYYAALAWLSFLSAAAFSIWFTLLKRPGVKVSDLNMWKFIIPVFGAILAWIILPDEHPDIVSITGMLITGSSLFLLNYLNRKKMKSLID